MRQGTRMDCNPAAAAANGRSESTLWPLVKWLLGAQLEGACVFESVLGGVMQDRVCDSVILLRCDA